MSQKLVGNYVLVSYNGAAAVQRSQDINLSLKPGYKPDLLYVTARVFNTMNGGLLFNAQTGELKGELISTHMGGSHFEMMVEGALSLGFSKGMKASRDRDTLILKTSGLELIFQSRDS